MRVIVLGLIVLFVGCTNKAKREDNFDLFDDTPIEALAEAVDDEDVIEIKRLIKKERLNVNYQEPKIGNTVLIAATINGKYKSAKALLECGANPNLHQKGDDDDALLIACRSYSKKCEINFVKLLTTYGADLNKPRVNKISGNPNDVITTPLMAATTSNCLNTVQYLVAHGADINQYVYHEGYGVITEAIIMDNIRIAKYFIIEMKAKIPAYCDIVKRDGKEVYQTITDKLESKNYTKGSENEICKQQILAYLRVNNLR